jgi:dTDP-4-dehydrorhamnose reductase
MRILVTALSGLLGLNLCLKYAHEHELSGVVNRRTLQDAPFPTVPLDLTDGDALKKVLVRSSWIPDHCAAMADVDRCERDPEEAWRINAQRRRSWRACAPRGTLVSSTFPQTRFSTGNAASYTEEDQPNPLSVYAAHQTGRRAGRAGRQQPCAGHPREFLRVQPERQPQPG